MPLARQAHGPASVRRTVLGAAALALTLALGACASLQPKAPEVEVAERAQQRWDALIKKDFAKAYTYTQPAFRAVVKPEIYPSRFTNAAEWKDVQVHQVNCEAERCTVRIRLNSKILLPAYRRLPDVVSYFDENWVRENGQWWYFDRY